MRAEKKFEKNRNANVKTELIYLANCDVTSPFTSISLTKLRGLFCLVLSHRICLRKPSKGLSLISESTGGKIKDSTHKTGT